MHDTNHKGNVAEAAIAAAAVNLGIPVLRPQFEHGRYDLVFEVDGRFVRVQCKSAPRHGDVVVVRLSGHRMTTRGSVRSTYSVDEIDAVVAYCEELDECYWLPIELVAGMGGIHLRLRSPLNGQRASINWAEDFVLEGAVAQLGERRSGTPKATGSSPVSSTPQIAPDSAIVGSNEFRRLFGWYAERAAAGHEIFVTRRGKPYVRLLPAPDQFALDGSARNGGPAGP
jgi:prevent-host-death family protein